MTDSHIFATVPPSASCYERGCRCRECKNDKNEVVRIQRQVQGAAVRWLRSNAPGTWERLMDEAYEAAGRDRRPVGRPRTPGSDWGWPE